jgi:two-component system cell cycle response regulator
MADQRISALLIDSSREGDDVERTLGEAGVETARAADLEEGLRTLSDRSISVVIQSLEGSGSLDAFERLRDAHPDVPVIVLTTGSGKLVGAAAVRAGAEDHVLREEVALLPRTIRYAIDQHRMRRELAELSTEDDDTGLLNLRGFIPIAEHHLRMSSRSGEPVILVFVQLDDLDRLIEVAGQQEGSRQVMDAADALRQVVRESDVLARIGHDIFCVLLTGGAGGAESVVLSRLVEAIAIRNSRGDVTTRMSVSVGTATSEDGEPSIDRILDLARRRMADQRAGGRSEGP